MTEILALIGSGLTLIIMALTEYFAAQKRARLADEKFVLDEATRKLIWDAALQKMLAKAKAEAARAQRIEDEIDRTRGGL